MSPRANSSPTQAVHATAIAIEGRALLIRGASKAGKSRLALSLIAASTFQRPIRLIGDDRVVISSMDGFLTARAHPRIAGFIERRGLGIVAMPFLLQAQIGGIVHLGACEAAVVGPTGSTTTSVTGLETLPTLEIVQTLEAVDQRDRVLDWWTGVCGAA